MDHGLNGLVRASSTKLNLFLNQISYFKSLYIEQDKIKQFSQELERAELHK